MNADHYPSTWEQTGRARDGVQFQIRPIRPGDADRERRFIDALSPQSRHQRFMHALHDPLPQLRYRKDGESRLPANHGLRGDDWQW